MAKVCVHLLVLGLMIVCCLLTTCFAQFDDGMFGGNRGFGGGGQRHFGLPNGAAHSHDNFDTEKTRDELISARMNPLPFIFNPGMRVGIAGLQFMERRSQQNPVARTVYSPVLGLLTNPSG